MQTYKELVLFIQDASYKHLSHSGYTVIYAQGTTVTLCVNDMLCSIPSSCPETMLVLLARDVQTAYTATRSPFSFGRNETSNLKGQRIMTRNTGSMSKLVPAETWYNRAS